MGLCAVAALAENLLRCAPPPPRIPRAAAAIAAPKVGGAGQQRSASCQ